MLSFHHNVVPLGPGVPVHIFFLQKTDRKLYTNSQMRSVRSSNSSPSKSSRRSSTANNGAAQSMHAHKILLNHTPVVVDEKPKSAIKKIKFTGPRNDPLDPEVENERMMKAEADQVKIDLFWVTYLIHYY